MAGPEDSPTAAICARVESDKRCGEAGWLHRLSDDNWTPAQPRRRIASTPPPTADINFAQLASEFAATLGPEYRKTLALLLGVSEASLSRLGVGWSVDCKAYSFPMSDAAGNVRGIRLRNRSGRKWAVRGSREGLFLPANLQRKDFMLICEGATDTASMLDLGFEAVGRPSCTGATWALELLARHDNCPPIVIVADRDAPGQRGAKLLATALSPYVEAVRVVTPPRGAKDARHWKNQGAKRDDVLESIASAPILRLSAVVGRAAG